MFQRGQAVQVVANLKEAREELGTRLEKQPSRVHGRPDGLPEAPHVVHHGTDRLQMRGIS